MRSVLFSKKTKPDPELLALKAELLDAQGDLALAYRQFDQAVDPELVESCIYQRRQGPVQLSDPGHQGAQPRGGRRCLSGRRCHVDLSQKVIAAILAGFFLIALIRVFSAPLRLALKLLVNTLLGFLALWAVGLTSGLTGITLGLNLWNALVIGVLGLPGFVLLLLVQWVL